MSKLETETAFTENLPDGWKSTMYESDRLRNLEGADTSILGDTVEEYTDSEGKTRTLTEGEIVQTVADYFLTQFTTPERTIEFPGLGLALEDGLLEQFAALYKEDNDTPSGTVKDVARAGTDDIVFTFATPEVYAEVADAGSDPSNFHQTGLTAGNTLELVGEGGIDTGTNSANTSLNLDDDEYMFFTGDYIDMSEGKSVVTATELVDVDGDDFGPVNGVFSNRLSGAHILTTQGTYASASIDIDAKIYDDGDAEVVPIAFYMGPGTKAPSLV